MNNKLPKRRNIFIKKAFQSRFILGVFGIILLSSLCSALLIYTITSGDLQAQSLSPHATIGIVWERLGMSILIGSVVSLLAASIVTVILVLYASHRIAGPLYRFEILCMDVGDGNLETITQLRANDQLQELAQSFSEMVNKLRIQRDRQAKLLVEINMHLSALKSSDNLTTEQRNTLARLTEEVTQFNRVGNEHT